MATVDEIGQEKQRISERLARLEAERTKLADQLNEAGSRRTRLDAIRRKSEHDRKTTERTPGENGADGRWRAPSARQPATGTQRVAERCHSESRAGAW